MLIRMDLQMFAESNSTVTVDFVSLEQLVKEIKEKVDRRADEDKENIRQMVEEAVRRAFENQPLQRKAGFEVPITGDINPKNPKEVLYAKADTNLKELQRKADDVYILSQLLGRPAKSLKYWAEYDNELRKTLGTDIVGEGSEWIPTGFSASLIEEVRLALKVAALHQRIAMPQDPYIIPGRAHIAGARFVGEGQTPSHTSSVRSRKVTLEAKKLMDYIPFPYELEEDSIVPILPIVREDIVKSLAYAQENATINGDDSATHMDSDVTAADDPRKTWKGYRAVCLATAKVDLATFNVQALRAIRKAMGKYGVQPADLAWVTSISGYVAMIGLPEVLTLDKYGPNATIITGELGRFDNIPIIVSEFVREDLNASGVYDGVTTNKTEIILVYRPGFLYGDRRDVMVEVDRSIKSQTVDMVASQRLDFEPRYDITEPLVAIGVNLAI